ncbi:MAG: 3'-5' exonuclease domain-containing protein 2 [Bacteroidales bacterium]|nr:3'-5' exonuclease domain-containing protein 2 [Bacteroidales bacterium]
MNAPNISLQDINRLPVIRFDGHIQVVDSHALLKKALIDINSHDKLLGFDTETRPSFKKGKTNQVSLLQLSTDNICYLFRLNRIGLPQELVDILSNPDIIKVGLSIHDDMRGLNKMAKFQPQGFVELQDFVQKFGIQEKSLKKICALVLNARISKNQQISNWDAPVLSEAQLTYAATDAWVCLKIYEKLNSIQVT